MRRVLALAIGSVLALIPVRAGASGAWGSPQYGDPPYFCTNLSSMSNGGYISWPPTNDPLISDNPNWQMYGIYPDPGYDDWFGVFYGDFRGTAGDSTYWMHLGQDSYPNPLHWDPSTFGWAFHGHVKMYLAYYNWTFGGQCGLGWYGNADGQWNGAPPFMAPQEGYGVMDFYVDSVPPYPPQPKVTEMTTSSVTFGWDPVADRADGAGQDAFAIGMGGYKSWLTLNKGTQKLQEATTSSPRPLTQSRMSGSDSVCVHVVAFDKLQNATPEQVLCANALSPPPMPQWPPMSSKINANPSANGLVGLDSWFWLNSTPAATTVTEQLQGVTYRVTATPGAAVWSFGDGTVQHFFGTDAFGQAYPQESSVRHAYQHHSQSGYKVGATIDYAVTWTANIDGRWVGPYPMGSISQEAISMTYAVEQAQPELTSAG